MSTERDPAVQRLLDRAAIEECLLRYTRGIDRHDTELTMSAFHPDALDTHGTFEGGPRQVAEWANEQHELRWTNHQHYITGGHFQFIISANIGSRTIRRRLNNISSFEQLAGLTVLYYPADNCGLGEGKMKTKTKQQGD